MSFNEGEGGTTNYVTLKIELQDESIIDAKKCVNCGYFDQATLYRVGAETFMAKLRRFYAEKIGVAPRLLVLEVDGREIEDQDTAKSLALQENAVLVARLKRLDDDACWL
ncbi:hypothetical protein AAVH_00070 [Aphelenchoides avenae]|nr:hypothetical protein AAVH_00070 [Aphelenchus avenae]